MISYVAFMFFGGLLVLAVAAIILRLACGLVGETAPTLGYAMVIVLGAMVVQSVAGLGLGVLGLGDSVIVALPASAACTSWVYSRMLPTSIARGLAIWVAQLLVIFILAFVISMGTAMLLGGASLL